MNQCCFTGHRKLPAKKVNRLLKKLKAEITTLIEAKITTFYCGGALGFDTMAAQTVISLKKEYPNIKLIFALPCKEQSKFWNKDEIALYQNLLESADEIIYTSEHDYKGCMHVRNRFMVDNSSYCICYLEKNAGGTAFTVKHAMNKGLVVKNIADIT